MNGRFEEGRRLRMECLSLAVMQSEFDGSNIIERAKRFEQYVFRGE